MGCFMPRRASDGASTAAGQRLSIGILSASSQLEKFNCPSRMSRPTSVHSLRLWRRRRDHLTRPIQPRHVLQRCLMPTRHVPSLSPTHPNTMSVVCVMCALSHRSGRRRSKTNSTTRPLPTSTRLPFRCTSALYGGLRFPRASSSARGTSRVYHGWAPAAQARRDE